MPCGVGGARDTHARSRHDSSVHDAGRLPACHRADQRKRHGKELLARYIHARSPVPIDLQALNRAAPTVGWRELFGRARAFTGAIQKKLASLKWLIPVRCFSMKSANLGL